MWRLSRGDYGWLTPALAPIHRDFGIEDLRPLAAACGVGATVLVQAAPTVAETGFLLATARASGGFVRGVVGWVDLAAADAVGALTALAREPLLKSIRPMLQDIADPAWILRPEIRPAVAALPELGLRFDALVKPPQLPALLTLLERHPELSVVVDHGGKPPIAAGLREPWARLIAAAAGHPGVHCKLSGLVTEARPDWNADTLRPWVDHLIDCFGPQRLMWGSDWPVVNLVADYARWNAAAETLLASLPPADRTAIFGGNAERFYGLATE